MMGTPYLSEAFTVTGIAVVGAVLEKALDGVGKGTEAGAVRMAVGITCWGVALGVAYKVVQDTIWSVSSWGGF